MSDASSIRKATTLPNANGFYASGIRYHNGQIWFSDGVEWQPLAVNKPEPVISTFSQTVSPATATIYTATSPVRLVSATFSFVTRETTATTLTASITKDTYGGAAGSGTATMSNSFACTGTGNANLVQAATLVSIAPTTGVYSNVNATTLSVGETLAIKYSASPTQLAGVTVVLTFVPVQDPKTIVTTAITASASAVAATAIAQTTLPVFIADQPYKLLAASCYYTTNAGGVATATLTKDTGVVAPGTGTLMTSATTWNLNSTASTYYWATLVGTAATVTLAAGDRVTFVPLGAGMASNTLVGTSIALYLQPVNL